MKIEVLKEKLLTMYGGKFSCEEKDNIRYVTGTSDNYDEIISVCFYCVSEDKNVHVVNDCVYTKKQEEIIHSPKLKDTSLDGEKPDVLVIGGGISGCSILRELSRYNLNLLLVEKESDLAQQTSSRNDGEIHPGVDLSKGSIKQSYVVRGNRMYDQISKELSVPFKRIGQIAGFTQWYLWPIIGLYCLQRKLVCGVDDTKLVSGRWIKKHYPHLNPKFKFGIYNPMSGVTSPYQMTIAFGENAVENGAKVSLNTIVTRMNVVDGKIVSVGTNRGTIYPKLVINAAGVFSEEIAKMAEDRFFSIHPRKGTIAITDKKSNFYIDTISSIKELKAHDSTHSKGGGSMRTVHDNLLLGPDAIETPLKEDTSTDVSSINKIIEKQSNTIPGISKRDIITYFAGTRAATFEEDFIIEKGRKTNNIIHVSGIQSPGLTTAPAVAVDVSKLAVDILKETQEVTENTSFNPYRKSQPVLKELDLKTRNELIKQNPDYGVIVCRCEEISKGEIEDCLDRVIKVPTIDGIKRRIRPGMGRCQGGFCMPLVAQIISEHEHIELKDVSKSNSMNHLGYFNKGDR